MSSLAVRSAAPVRCLEDFRGDYDSVSALTRESWSENNQQSLLYTSDFLESCFDYPGSDVSLAPTIYDGSNPVAFVAGFPRRIQFAGKELRVLLVTFLTVAPQHKKKGYGIILWSELVSRARAAGFDGMVNYGIAGSTMDSLIPGCCERLGLATARVYSIGYLSGILSPAPDGSDPSIEDPPGGREQFFREAARIRGLNGLSRIWEESEAEWQCERRYGAVLAHHSGPGRFGVLTGYVMPALNSHRTKCLFIEDVLWFDLDASERLTLAQKLINRARAAGAEMATVPRCGYADLKAFAALGFQRTRRVVHAYLTVWRGPIPDGAVTSFYLDVL